MAAIPQQRNLVERLCYTYRECFVSRLEDLRTTKISKPEIPLRPDVNLGPSPPFTS